MPSRHLLARIERLALNGFDAGRQPPVRIGDGNADGLGAEIEPDQRTALGPMCGGFDQREDGGGHGKRITRVPWRRQREWRHGILANATPLFPKPVYRIATGLMMLCTAPV